jgi:hypothetical protein
MQTSAVWDRPLQPPTVAVRMEFIDPTFAAEPATRYFMWICWSRYQGRSPLWTVDRARYEQSGYVVAQPKPGWDTIDSLRFQSVLPLARSLCVLFPAGILSLTPHTHVPRPEKHLSLPSPLTMDTTIPVANTCLAVCSEIPSSSPLRIHQVVTNLFSLVKVKLCPRLNYHRLSRLSLGEANSLLMLHFCDMPATATYRPLAKCHCLICSVVYLWFLLQADAH